MALKAKTQIETDMEELHNQIENLTKSKESVSLDLITTNKTSAVISKNLIFSLEFNYSVGCNIFSEIVSFYA